MCCLSDDKCEKQSKKILEECASSGAVECKSSINEKHQSTDAKVLIS